MSLCLLLQSRQCGCRGNTARAPCYYQKGVITWLSLSETLPDVARSPSLTLDFHPPTGQKTTAQQWGKLVCENIRDRCWRIYAVVVVISARIEIPTFSFFFFFSPPYASSTSEVLFVLQLSLLRQPFSCAILPDPFAVGGAAWDLPTFQTVAPFFFFFFKLPRDPTVPSLIRRSPYPTQHVL